MLTQTSGRLGFLDLSKPLREQPRWATEVRGGLQGCQEGFPGRRPLIDKSIPQLSGILPGWRRRGRDLNLARQQL